PRATRHADADRAGAAVALDGLLAVAHARRLVVLGIDEHHVRHVNGSLVDLDATGGDAGCGLRRLAVLRDAVDALDEHAVALGVDLEHLPLLAAVASALLARAGDDLHQVTLLDLELRHDQSTSGASETIFINFLSRSSRPTGPKMRVPRGSPSALRMTAAFSSKRMYEPSGRRRSLTVRTMTALTTSPFLTLPPGIASLTVATIWSPMPA